jgi:hypothetical protein
VYHGGQILNTSIDVGYDIRVGCTFSADETINLRDLKRQIHAGLLLYLPENWILIVVRNFGVYVFYCYV